MTIQSIYRNRPLIRLFVAYMIVAHGVQLILPTTALALTSGPSQPETSSFTPVGITDMVDPFTGGFSYNIPLLSVGGYPLNLSYHANGGMDTEASYVGYNWNLGVGALNHSIQAMPDDFKGDEIVRELNIRRNNTIGGSIGAKWELFGSELQKDNDNPFGSLSANLGAFWNNYRGWGFQFSVSPAFDVVKTNKGPMTAGLSLGFNSQSGVDLSADLSFPIQEKFRNDANRPLGGILKRTVGVGGNFNSRGGLKMLSLNTSGSYTDNKKVLRNLTLAKNKRKKATMTATGSGSLSFGSPSYTPQLSFPFTSLNFTFNASFGGSLLGTHPKMKIEGNYSTQYIPRSKRLQRSLAYGYAYLDEAPDEFSSPDPITMDFNYEGDGPLVQKSTPNLPVTRPGFDIYSASGHGLSSNFRAFRDPGTVYDPKMRSNSIDASGGIEIGGGALFHGGGNIGGVATMSSSGKWTKTVADPNFLGVEFSTEPANDLGEVFRYQAQQNPKHENFFFKQLGELSVDEDPIYDKLGGDELVRVAMKSGLSGVTGKVDADVVLEDNAGDPIPAAANGTAADFRRDPNQRVKRNQTFQMLTAEEAQFAAVEKMIRSYPLNTFDYVNGEMEPNQTIGRLDGDRKAHHFSSASVTRQDGAIYDYGIPVLNHTQREVTFNTATRTNDIDQGLVTYLPGTDNSVDNMLGDDRYFQATTTPAYAHSYLLTSIRMPNYVDIEGDGITDNDIGDAYEFHYTRLEERYPWRTPIQQNQANYSEGFESEARDDKGSYTYGEKEIWYIHSIENKQFVALFTYDESRKDSYGVDGENGGVSAGSHNLVSLQKISLYAKNEYRADPTTAVPIKEVHFGYDNSLCGNLPNSPTASGKLTLKTVSFTGRNSKRGLYNTYQFTYGDFNHDGIADDVDPVNPDSKANPDYHPKAYDQWGNYKENDPARPNGKYPYPIQDPVVTDKFAGVYLLHTIQLPSGGLIKMDYEMGRYAYVKDRRATQMFDLHGIGEDPADFVQAHNKLFEKLTTNGYKNYNTLFFQLPQPIQGNDDAEFKRRYLTQANGKLMEEMYFNFRVPVNRKKKDKPRIYEQVAGFVRVEDAGMVPGQPDYGWIRVAEYGIKKESDNKKANGIARACWLWVRENMPQRLFPGSDPSGTGEQAIQALGGFLMEMRAMFTGFRRIMRDQHFADHVEVDKSWIRLYSPYGNKIGGSPRIKALWMENNWGDMTNSAAPNRSFGQKYEYTTTDPVTGETISSGVATTMPLLGKADDPFYEPIRFEKINTWSENDEYFITGPLAPFADAAPMVGYSEVKISNFIPDAPNAQVTRHGQGYSVKKFYTAKDFPPIFEETVIEGNGNPRLKGLQKIHFAWFNQGYLIKRNDMHGKPYCEEVYAEGGTERISRVEYKYRIKEQSNPFAPKELDNENVKVINPDGTTSFARIGKEMEFVLNERQQQTRAFGLKFDGNVEVMLLAIFPSLPIPTVFPSPVYEHTRARSMVATKIIDQYGLLKEIVATEGNATVSTHHLAYDAQTGGVLVTKTTNEFKDPVYNYTQPAHMVYERMGQAYQNLGMNWSGVSLSSLSNNPDLVKGDELLLVADGTNTTVTEIGWVLDAQSDGGSLYVIDREGTLIDPTKAYARIQVIRSGRRNLATTPVASFVTMEDPLDAAVSGGLQHLQTGARVINASATTFGEEWQMQCGNPAIENECQCIETTQAALDLQTLLNVLAQNSELINSNVDLTAHYPSYINGTALATAIGVDPSCQLSWLSSGTVTVNNCSEGLTAQLVQTCNGVSTALFTLDLQSDPTNPYSLCWEHLNSFSGLTATIPDPTACADEMGFTINGQIDYCNGSGTSDVLVLNGTVDNFLIRDCETIPHLLFACAQPGDKVNPYTRGLRGNWRPIQTSIYMTDLKNSGAQNLPTPLMSPDVATNGTYTNFNAMFQYVGGEWIINDQGWTTTEIATRYLPQGQMVESKDPLDRYSAAIFGYEAQLPIGIAANATNQQIAVANFEVSADIGIDCRASVQFVNAENSLTSTYAHTGNQSMAIAPGLSIANSPFILAGLNPNTPCDPTAPDGTPFVLSECDCAGNFTPTREEAYLLSFWVSSDEYYTSTAAIGGFDDLNLVVEVDGFPVTLDYLNRGILLDGWQRYEAKVMLTTSVSPVPSPGVLEIRFLNQHPTHQLYVDDFKFQPVLSSLVTHVYDPETQLLMASLDDNHFATIYTYNSQGELISTLQETEKGIQSLSESRSYLPPNQ